MKKKVVVVLLNVLCCLACEQIVPGQKRTESQSRTSSIKRDAKLERAVANRYNKLTTMLQPEAKRKLVIASRALRKELAKSPEPSDPYKSAREEINRQFVGLSAEQSDLLSFYILADVARLATKLIAGEKVAELDKLSDMSEMGETESLRLQMMMDRLSKLMTTLSNILKKTSDTANSIIQNIRG